MFRLLPRGLPMDPEYPTNLKDLGYFINEDDEIRNTEDPKFYFKYFITRNERYNERQRESMNAAIREIVAGRLKFHDMETVPIPLGTSEKQPHIPILVSKNISTASRVVILFGEKTQDLGIFSHRIIGGHGGINAGSAVNFVKYVQGLPSNLGSAVKVEATPDGNVGVKGDAPSDDHLGIILANCGQLNWHRRSGRAITTTSWDALTRPSAVHDAVVFDPIANTVKRNRTQEEYIAHLLGEVIPQLCRKDVKLDVIAVTDSARGVSEYLDDNWDQVKEKMQSLALVFPYYDQEKFQNGEFKEWLKRRARGYIMAESPPGMGVFGPMGGKKEWQRGYGMNIYGLPEEVAAETVFPRQFTRIVDWMQEVAQDPAYENEEIVSFGPDDEDEEPVAESHWVGAEYWDTEEGKAQLEAGKREREEAWKGAAGNGLEVFGKKDMDAAVEKAKLEAGSQDDADGKTEDVAAREILKSVGTAGVGLDGVSDDMVIPPEKMERLPSYVKTDDSAPEVTLTKEEKAAILQTTALSSPVKEKAPAKFSGDHVKSENTTPRKDA